MCDLLIWSWPDLSDAWSYDLMWPVRCVLLWSDQPDVWSNDLTRLMCNPMIWSELPDVLSKAVVPYAVRFRASDLFFSIPKYDSIGLCSSNMKNPTDFFRFGNRMARVVRFGLKSDDLVHQIFQSKNGMVSTFKTLSRTTSSSREIDELDDDTAEQRRCFAPVTQSAGVAFVRGQITAGWRELGPRDQEKHTRRAPLRGYVLVDSSSKSQCEIRNTKTGWLYVAHLACLFATRLDAVSVGSDAWVLRAAQLTRRVSSRRQTTTTAVGLGVCPNLCTHNKSFFSHRKTYPICKLHSWKCDRVKIWSSKSEMHGKKPNDLMIWPVYGVWSNDLIWPVRCVILWSDLTCPVCDLMIWSVRCVI